MVKIEYQQEDKFGPGKYLLRNYLYSIKTVFHETNVKIVLIKMIFMTK